MVTVSVVVKLSGLIELLALRHEKICFANANKKEEYGFELFCFTAFTVESLQFLY